MKYNKKDHYHQKAKKEGYFARSAYKLKEIQDRYKIMRNDANVLDLGCSPGAWSQVALEFLSDKGAVGGIDLEQAELEDPRFTFLLKDIFALEPQDFPLAPYSCLLSDMAPKTTGIKVRDQSRSYDLAEKAILLSDALLAPKGNLLLKVFEGPDLPKLIDLIRQRFQRAERLRPDSTRQASTEIYLIGLQKK